MTKTTDIPALIFADPDAADPTYRVCLWAASGEGKTCAAVSAPGPILAVSADRPTAYRFARTLYPKTVVREVRYVDAGTLEAVYAHLNSDEGADVRTVILDPIGNIYDQLVDVAPVVNIKGREAPNYQWVNKKLLGFVQALRRFDVNLVLIAHEKLGADDAKLYPDLGGPSLINKLLAEMDIVAHIERVVRPGKEDEDGEEELWIGQIQPRDNLVCKDGTGALGDRRIANLSRWFEVANEALRPDDSDLPFDLTPGAAETAADAPGDTEAGDDVDVQQTLADAA